MSIKDLIMRIGGKDPNGDLKGLSVDLQGNVKINPLGVETIISSESNRSVAQSTITTIVEESRPSIIDSMEIAVPQWGALRIGLMKPGQSISDINSNMLVSALGQGGRYSPTVGDIANHGSHFFEIREFDTENSEYSIGLKPGVHIYLPQGFRFQVRNLASSERLVTHVVTYRRF